MPNNSDKRLPTTTGKPSQNAPAPLSPGKDRVEATIGDRNESERERRAERELARQLAAAPGDGRLH
jgi:hypothetical protein